MTLRSLIDLSHPLDPQTPVYPDYPRVEITILESTKQVKPGRRAHNSSQLAIGLHCGTHMDAPFHFYETGRTIDQVPLDWLVGPCFLVDVRQVLPGGQIGVSHLAGYREKLKKTRRVVLNTGWSRHWGEPEYFADHPVVSTAAAQLLVDFGVHLLGIDTPSVDFQPSPAHLTLLGNNAVIVENLTNLEAITKESFELVVLPLKITGAEGSPVRAAAWVA